MKPLKKVLATNSKAGVVRASTGIAVWTAVSWSAQESSAQQQAGVSWACPLACVGVDAVWHDEISIPISWHMEHISMPVLRKGPERKRTIKNFIRRVFFITST
jgi:hypothetical protein